VGRRGVDMRFRLLLVFGALVLLAAVPAFGAPNKGATWDRYTATATYVDVSAPGCPDFAGVYPLGAGVHYQDLEAAIRGWFGPQVLDEFGTPLVEPVRLNANLHGPVTDARGNTFNVAGHFSDNSIHVLQVPMAHSFFNGEGSAVLAGDAGTIEGDAALVYYGDNPSSITVRFTNIRVCHIMR
jgi:hypothetical protein